MAHARSVELSEALQYNELFMKFEDQLESGERKSRTGAELSHLGAMRHCGR